MSDIDRNDKGVSILVGDSSGAGGLSVIAALDEVMGRVQAESRLAESPLVEEYFDLVAGGGIAAIIAVMVGRLGMTTGQAMKGLANLANEVFSDKKTIGTGTFKASKMEKVLRDIIREATGNEDEPMLNEQAENQKCKTMVFAMSKHNMNAGIPTIFRSYHVTANRGPKCTIWQALRAATAHPEMFKSMEIEDQGISEMFVDAAMGCGNPIEHVLAEAKLLYPNRRVACIISIGGGHPRTIHIPEPNPFQRIFPTNLIVAMRDIATDNERMAQTMAMRFQEVPDVYFRLNVDQGMQSVRIGNWDRLGEIRAHTRAYMLKVQTNIMIGKAVKVILGRKGVIAMEQVDGQVVPEIELGLKQCPAPTPVYIERQQPINQAIGCLTSPAQERRVFVFYGLGGTGKTQLALHMVEQTREHWSDVIYIDATSTQSLTSSLQECAVARRIGETYEDTLRWLSAYMKPWLLVIDNADDPSIGLQQYLPKGTHGRILITTRNRDIALLAKGPGSDYNVSGMEHAEGLQLLMTVSRMNDQTLSEEERTAATTILKAIDYLALAIVQAGAYIWRTSCSFVHYWDLYIKQPQTTLEKYSQMPVKVDDYQKTVYVTWKMSYSLLSDRAQQTLWILAYLQRDQITENIFQRAAACVKGSKDLSDFTEAELEPVVYVARYLGFFLDQNDEWDTDAFLSVMTELTSCSLISLDRVNRTYVLHVLVQVWARTEIPHSPEAGVTHSVLLIALSALWGGSQDSYTFRQSLQWHVRGILKYTNRIHAVSLDCFVKILLEAGDYQQASALQIQMVDGLKQKLGENHPHTLGHISNLALTYSNRGLYKQAETLLVQVLEGRKKALGEQHAETMMSLDQLASVLFRQGRYEEAELLQTRALKGLKETLGDEHLDTLAVMGNLASSYAERGLHAEAKEIWARVLECRKQRLGERHPSTLAAMHNLVATYNYQGLYKESEQLQLQAIEYIRQLSGEKHPHTLFAMQGLATLYNNQGLWKKAETWLVQILEDRKQVLGELHPDTLHSMSELARTYIRQGLYQQGEPLQIQALEGFKHIFGDEHRDTLLAMEGLANSYSERGLHKEAEGLQIQVLEGRKKKLGDQHPKTLTVMHNLAVSYSQQGQYEQAEKLWDHVVETREKTLGEQHPMTLTAMEYLAITYSNQRLWEPSRALLTRVLEGRNQVLGKQHPETLLTINNLAKTFVGQGLNKKAESLHVRALEGLKEIVGDQHPNTLHVMNCLALTYTRQGQHKEAEELRLRLLEIRKLKLGDGHPSTLSAMRNLADSYYQQGLYERAETLQVQALEGFRQAFGDHHIETVSSAQSLISTYQKLGPSRQKKYKDLSSRIGQPEPVELKIRSSSTSIWAKIMLLLLIVSPAVILVFSMVPPAPPPRTRPPPRKGKHNRRKYEF